MLKKRVNARALEWVLFISMMALGLAAIYIFFATFSLENPDPIILIVELLLLVLIVLLGIAAVLVKLWEQHLVPYYLHKKTHEMLTEK